MVDLFYVLLGAAISLGVSIYFAERSSQELKTETADLKRETLKLRRASSMVVVSLVEAGQIEPENVKVDPDTRLVDFVLVKGETMDRMVMHPDQKALLYSMIGDPLPAAPEKPWWRRMFGG